MGISTKFLKGNRGFTLIELMIVVGIIGFLAAIAIPSYLKFQFDAKEAEGVSMLLAARKAQEIVRMQRNAKGLPDEYTEVFESDDPRVLGLDLRLANKSPHFNLILGTTGYTTSTYPTAHVKYTLTDLNYNVPSYPLFKFGLMAGGGGAPTRYLMGAIGDLRGNGNLHVLGIDENGVLIKICDGWTGQPSAAGMQIYQTYSAGGAGTCSTGDDGDSGSGFGGGG